MKDLLDRFGLVEVLAYLCPGALLLCSAALWAPPPPKADPPADTKAEGKEAPGHSAEEEGWKTFTLSAFLVLLAYALGMIVSTASSETAAFYVRRGRCLRRLWEVKGRPLGSCCWLGFRHLLHWMLCVFIGFPDLRTGDKRDDHRLKSWDERIRRDLADRQGKEDDTLPKLTRLPWGVLPVYRTAVADHVGKAGLILVREADAVHRRFLFAQGVALTSALVALHIFVRLLLAFPPPLPGGYTWKPILLPDQYAWTQIPPTVLLLLVAFSCLLVGWVLRWVAGRWWEAEFTLTCILHRAAAEHDAAAAQRAAGGAPDRRWLL